MSPLFREFSFARPTRSSASLERERRASVETTDVSHARKGPVIDTDAAPALAVPSGRPSLQRRNADFVSDVGDLTAHLSAQTLEPSPSVEGASSSLAAAILTPPPDAINEPVFVPTEETPTARDRSPSPFILRPYSPNFVRRQRQRNIRLQCDDDHLRRIAELVESMVKSGEACCVYAAPTTPAHDREVRPKGAAPQLPIFRPNSHCCVKKQARVRRTVS